MLRYLILAILFALPTGGIFYYHTVVEARISAQINQNKENQLSIDSILNTIGQVEMLNSNPLPKIVGASDNNSSPIDLSTDEYIKILNEIDTIIFSDSPIGAINWLRGLYAESEGVRDSCHGLMHYVGQIAYKKYENFGYAVNAGDDFCGNGYVHGVIERYFGSMDSLEGKFLDLCASNDVSCVHGVGHGFMYFYENDLPEALSNCEKYPSEYLRVICSEGIFHENFETNAEEHVSKYLNPSDPTYPCGNYFGSFREVCMYYSGRYIVRVNNNNYKAAIKACESTYSPISCASGVGSITMRQNFDNPIAVQETCMHGGGDLPGYCLGGAISYHRVNSRSTNAFKEELCRPMADNYFKNSCLAW